MKDVLDDVVGQAAMRRGMEAVRRKKAHARLQELQKENNDTTRSTTASEGAYECAIEARVLTRKVQVVIDTGASHNIVSLRTIHRLRLKSLIKPSRKAFITAGGGSDIPRRRNRCTAADSRRMRCPSQLHGN